MVAAPSTVTVYSVAVRTTTVSPFETDWSEAGATRSWAPTLTPALLRASPAVVKNPDTSRLTPSTSTVTWRYEVPMAAAPAPATRRAVAVATEMTVVREGLTLTGLQTS